MDFNKKLTGNALKFQELTEKIVDECGYILYDAEYIPGSSTLRVFIMDKETKSAVIEDCVKVDRAFTPYCEELAWIPDDFVLEVSSPGVYRSLKSLEHFRSSEGEFVSLTLTKAIGEIENINLPKSVTKNKKIRALLKTVLEDKIVIEIEDQSVEVSFEQIKKAHVDPDLNG